MLASRPALPLLSPAEFLRMISDGAQVIDVRTVQSYAAGHIRGSLAIPLRPAFASWLGWLVTDPRTALVIVAEPDSDTADLAWQAAKIGYENLAGVLAGGIPAWLAAGEPVASVPLTTAAHVEPASVVDVRQAAEYAGGHLPSARGVELGGLAGVATDLAGGPVVTMCGHGERAATAASVLERAGIADVAILPGGPDDWARATGQALEAGT